MANFNEHALELSITELFKDEGYTHLSGEQIHRECTLYNRYAKDGITLGEVDSILLRLRNISGMVYEANKAIYNCCATALFSTVRTGRRRIYISS